ncbi:MAG: hypothetical protein II824_05435 [Bacteroidales bacterium]|nr:hypothetical protein [Bacteroidales bacterium]
MEDTSPKGEQPQNIRIEVTRYKSLLDALGDWKKVFRVIVTISVTGLLLFAGVMLVVLSVKRIYPYSDITTNALGATTIKNEKSEVSYWLLNTAELWANSGIKVKKGQTIHVIASGKKHTAIHHLVEDAKENADNLRDPWVGTEGSTDRPQERDQARRNYRIFPHANQDALLMQIVPPGQEPEDRPMESSSAILIGKQREVHVEKDGVLHFAINDIVLDDDTIARMMLEMTGSQKSPYVAVKELKEKGKSITYHDFLTIFGTDEKAFQPVGGKFGKFAFGKNRGTDEIELFGYYRNAYKTPWFEDNVGSFLIIVESVND